MLDLFEVDSGSTADISECGRYRYQLTRQWNGWPIACFIMLNPSTADAAIDDPTIRRCVGFAKREGCGGLIVANLFAWRATDPRSLLSSPDAIGPRNDASIAAAVQRARESGGPVIAAWGAMKLAAGRAAKVTADNPGMSCLGMTASGSPRHPLYVKGDQPLLPLEPRP